MTEKELLKQTVRRVIAGQGNRYIKELLRSLELPIGSTKADFVANLIRAIDDGAVTTNDIVGWLAEVEGWGNQHLYFWRPLSIAPNEIVGRVRNSPYRDLLLSTGSLEFPDKLKLTSIEVEERCVTFSWHRGNDRWIHVPTRDYQEDRDGDTWEFRAFRRNSNRTVVRFEWRFDSPYSSTMIQLPKDGGLHDECIDMVWETLRSVRLIDDPMPSIQLSAAVNSLSTERLGVTATNRKMLAEGGHVDVVSTIPDRGIAEIEALRTVSGAIDPDKFHSADGRFRLEQDGHAAISRPIGFEIAGAQGRVRVSVQCLRADIWYLNDQIMSRNQTR